MKIGIIKEKKVGLLISTIICFICCIFPFFTKSEFIDKIIIFIILGLFNVGQSRATCNIYENIEPDTTQLDIRINPTLEQNTCSHPLVKEYNYLKLNKNYISYAKYVQYVRFT